jgi:hypothetical protein
MRITRPHHVRRLARTAKTSRVVVLGGAVADLAGAPPVEVFRRHYAHGTTAHVLASRAVTSALQQVIRTISTRPNVSTIG